MTCEKIDSPSSLVPSLHTQFLLLLVILATPVIFLSLSVTFLSAALWKGGQQLFGKVTSVKTCKKD